MHPCWDAGWVRVKDIEDSSAVATLIAGLKSHNFLWTAWDIARACKNPALLMHLSDWGGSSMYTRLLLSRQTPMVKRKPPSQDLAHVSRKTHELLVQGSHITCS